jgi:formate dehydrogenase major subunit
MKQWLNTPVDNTPNTELMIDGKPVPIRSGELLIDVLNLYATTRNRKPVPQVCYLPQMGPIETCDTCMVKVNGELVRACGTRATADMVVETAGEAVDIAQREARLRNST